MRAGGPGREDSGLGGTGLVEVAVEGTVPGRMPNRGEGKTRGQVCCKGGSWVTGGENMGKPKPWGSRGLKETGMEFREGIETWYLGEEQVDDTGETVDWAASWTGLDACG